MEPGFETAAAAISATALLVLVVRRFRAKRRLDRAEARIAPVWEVNRPPFDQAA